MAKKTEKTVALMGLFQTLSAEEQAQFINVTRQLEVNASDEQYFTNVTKAMQAAGYNPFKRGAAGLKAYARNRMESSKGINSRTSARALRLLGMGKSADFIDRWLTKAPPRKISLKGKKGAKSAVEKDLESPTSKKIDTGSSGSLIAITKQLTFVAASIERISEDIGDIKSLIMPREITAKGETVEDVWKAPDESAKGQIQHLLYNPLAPAGEQFLQVQRTPSKEGWTDMTKPGKLTKKGVDKGFERDAKKRAAKETADLALKIIEKDRERVELKKKFEYKDKAEREADPLEVLRSDMDKKFDEVFKRLDEKKRGSILDTIMGAFGGLWNKITSFFKNPFGILTGLAALMPLATLIGKAGLVGMAGVIGYEVGTWLNEKFKLSEKINDAIQWGMKLFGKSNEDKIHASDKAAVAEKNRKTAEINVKLEGTGYKKEEMTISKDGTVYHGGGYVDAEGNRVLVKDLPQEVKDIVGIETELTKDAAPAAGPKTRARRGRAAPVPSKPTSTEPAITSFPPMPSEMPAIEAEGKTGKLTKGEKYPGEESIKNQIKKHEGLRLEPYQDSLGKWTVGYGHLIGDGTTLPQEWKRKISKEEADALFEEDYLEHRKAASKIPGFDKLNSRGKAALIDLTYNMGPNWVKMKGFKKFEAAMNKPIPDVEAAADALEDSMWYNQVKGRAKTVVGDLRAGIYSSESTTSPGTMVAGGNGEATPAMTIPGSKIDGDSRILQASNAPSSVNMFGAPTTINATRVSQTVGKRPVAKADVLTRDPSIIRTASKDAVHPVYG